MKIKPCRDNLLIELKDIPSNGSIELPEGHRRFTHGLVIDVGPTAKDFKVGDRVLALPECMMGFGETPEDAVYILSEHSVVARLEL
jgi:hypothetical protein